jgi:hypothetical protein
MKLYTSESQTAKLIELGFEKPKSISGYYQRGPYEYDAETNTKMVVYDDTQYPIYAYSIGELIEILPGRINGIDLTIERYYAFEQWLIYYDASQYFTKQTELIYALYDMVVKLKEEGVI